MTKEKVWQKKALKSIKITEKTWNMLRKSKIIPRETFDDVINRLITEKK